MDQNNLGWTALLTDDAWFLSEPLPTGAELYPQPPDVHSSQSLSEAWKSGQQATDMAGCPWRFNAIDPFMGCDARTARLGGFGMGFPDGELPETVPGWFTGTAIELGQRNVLDDDILFKDLSFKASAGVAAIDHYAPHPGVLRGESPSIMLESDEDEQQSYMSTAVTSFEVEESVATSIEEQDLVACAAATDCETANNESAALCPTTTGGNMHLENQVASVEQRICEHLPVFLDNTAEESDAWVPEYHTETVQKPKKYQRKRKMQNLSAEIVAPEDCDSDSDYTPDPRSTKRARKLSSTAYFRPEKTPQKLPKARQGWHVKDNYQQRRQPVAQHKPAKLPTIPEYAKKANQANFAAVAKRARYALAATVLQPGPGPGYMDSDLEVARQAFSQLNEAFDPINEHQMSLKGCNRALQQVVYANSAVEAMFARHATSAEVILELG